jgi:hypothetical protein
MGPEGLDAAVLSGSVWQLPPIRIHASGNFAHAPDSAVPAGHSVLTRTDPAEEALSRYVLDAALDARLDAAAPMLPGAAPAIGRPCP